ncbi:MAG: isoprenylcysteine carboxylmethyltransferase family protein [Deltaproteobacteria bacterium]|nr:isoprenylcysteine carboxylmethyltransferase family protein [Deltaproteobacteria bacterium]
MKIRTLMGSGDRIALLALPFVLVGLRLNVLHPSLFSVGGPSLGLKAVAVSMLGFGVVVWLWSAILILTRVPRHALITNGPFAVVKHPLYTGVGLLVVPFLGLLLDSYLGILIGLVIYAGSRIFSPIEEKALSREFGRAWDDYCKKVALPWL